MCIKGSMYAYRHALLTKVNRYPGTGEKTPLYSIIFVQKFCTEIPKDSSIKPSNKWNVYVIRTLVRLAVQWTERKH